MSPGPSPSPRRPPDPGRQCGPRQRRRPSTGGDGDRWTLPDRFWPTVAVVVVVVVAGCAGFGSSGAGGGDGGDAGTGGGDGGDADTGQDGGASVDLPPGTSGAGIDNATLLVTRHRRGLVHLGFDLRERTVVGSSGSRPNRTVGSRRLVAPDVEAYYVRERHVPGAAAPFTRERWSNGTVAVQRTAERNHSVYRPTHRRAAPRALVGGKTLRTYLRRGDFEPVERRSLDGVPVFLFVAGDYEAPARPGTVERFEARLLVDSRGRIHRFRANLTRSVETAYGERTHVRRYRYRVTSLGEVAVDPPGWIDRAAASENGSRRRVAGTTRGRADP